MNLRKTDAFLADVERQLEWYALRANWEVAERYLNAVEIACHLVARYPGIGPRGGFAHSRLRDWRFLLVFPPFKKHINFYEVSGDDVILRRTMHGHRDFPRRLLEPSSDE